MLDYDHSLNLHSLEGPQAAFPEVFRSGMPTSLLDVGCGTGTWLRAAMDCGIKDLRGVDGLAVPPDQLLFPGSFFQVLDFRVQWDLGRRFEAALCLEVAEHLEARHSNDLLDSLTRHSDFVVFSAACPGQPGQHHVNCQWPAYWQRMFNDRGYVCSDAVRWRLWELEAVEPWYRQNIFTARRAPAEAGREPRIPAVVHPGLIPWLKYEMFGESFGLHVEQIEEGRQPLGWYFKAPFWALWSKMRRRQG